MKTILVFLLLFVPLHGQENKEISNIVRDLIENEKIPSVLSAFTCWSKLDQFHLIKTSKIPTQLNSQLKIQPRISDDQTNKLWHFIDMRCAGSYKFMHAIDGAYFAHPYRWIIYEPIEERMMNLTLLPDSNVIFIHFHAETGRFNIKQGNFDIFQVLISKTV